MPHISDPPTECSCQVNVHLSHENRVSVKFHSFPWCFVLNSGFHFHWPNFAMLSAIPWSGESHGPVLAISSKLYCWSLGILREPQLDHKFALFIGFCAICKCMAVCIRYLNPTITLISPVIVHMGLVGFLNMLACWNIHCTTEWLWVLHIVQ